MQCPGELICGAGLPELCHSVTNVARPPDRQSRSPMHMRDRAPEWRTAAYTNVSSREHVKSLAGRDYGSEDLKPNVLSNGEEKEYPTVEMA